MSHVSIIGGGNLGQAIATIVTKGGHTVEVFNSNDPDKPVTGDVVFLAVRYPAVANVLAQRGDQLAGKVVVGITKNPLNFETIDSLGVPADTSAAAEIASSLPMPGWHRAPDEGPSRWWYLGMIVLVLTLFALLTLLHRA
jgi:predicted dinucleotide-binding enzyme